MEIFEAVLRLYKKKYKVLPERNEIVVFSPLCRKFFKVLNDRIEGENFWYNVEGYIGAALLITKVEGKQI